MRTNETRRPGTVGTGEGRVAEGRIAEGHASGVSATLGRPYSEALPSDLQALFDESFRRNEPGLRYLANR